MNREYSKPDSASVENAEDQFGEARAEREGAGVRFPHDQDDRNQNTADPGEDPDPEQSPRGERIERDFERDADGPK